MAYVEKLGERTRPQTFTQRVTEQLREMILSGEVKEGQQLRQDMVAAILHVSRIPVREALRQLEAEGLITFFPHRGAIVAELSLDDIREVFDARALLECDMLERAIPKWTASDHERAEDVLVAFDNAMTSQDVRVSAQLNWQFHSILYAPAKRPRMMGMIQNLGVSVDRYLRLHLKLTGSAERARTDHRTILEFCRRRQSDEACGHLRKHILDAGDALIEFLTHRRMESTSDRVAKKAARLESDDKRRWADR